MKPSKLVSQCQKGGGEKNVELLYDCTDGLTNIMPLIKSPGLADEPAFEMSLSE